MSPREQHLEREEPEQVCCRLLMTLLRMPRVSAILAPVKESHCDDSSGPSPPQLGVHPSAPWSAQSTRRPPAAAWPPHSLAAPREIYARGLIVLEDSLHIFVCFCALELNNEFPPGGEPLPPAGGGGMLVKLRFCRVGGGHFSLLLQKMLPPEARQAGLGGAFQTLQSPFVSVLRVSSHSYSVLPHVRLVLPLQ